MLYVSIEVEDVRQARCDVLILKYPQAFYGATAAVAEALNCNPHKRLHMDPEPDKHVLIEAGEMVAAAHVLFVGVVPLRDLGYQEIRSFTARSLNILSEESALLVTGHVAMTMHGVGYGLDEQEAFLSQIGGIMDALTEESPWKKISIFEKDPRRAERLREILFKKWPEVSKAAKSRSKELIFDPHSISAGKGSLAKPHIFVAMPFDDAFYDTYVYGIQRPINDAGYLCERIDMKTFTGDVMTLVKERIETATLVVADLTGNNPNVYLEVGYAIGKERRTLLFVKDDAQELAFDLRSHRCIKYKNISDLEKKLKEDLQNIKNSNR
jgi:hypothetical protein